MTMTDEEMCKSLFVGSCSPNPSKRSNTFNRSCIRRHSDPLLTSSGEGEEWKNLFKGRSDDNLASDEYSIYETFLPRTESLDARIPVSPGSVQVMRREFMLPSVSHSRSKSAKQRQSHRAILQPIMEQKDNESSESPSQSPKPIKKSMARSLLSFSYRSSRAHTPGKEKDWESKKPHATKKSSVIPIMRPLTPDTALRSNSPEKHRSTVTVQADTKINPTRRRSSLSSILPFLKS